MPQPFNNEKELLDHIRKATKPLEGKNPAEITNEHLAKLILGYNNPNSTSAGPAPAQAIFTKFGNVGMLTITKDGQVDVNVKGSNEAKWEGVSPGALDIETAGDANYTATNIYEIDPDAQAPVLKLVIIFYDIQWKKIASFVGEPLTDGAALTKGTATIDG